MNNNTVAKSPKITKEILIKENVILTERLKETFVRDLAVRTKLSELLGSVSIKRSFGYPDSKREVDVQDWVGIAFLIGELKADADFSLLLNREEGHKRDVEILSDEINRLKNPHPKQLE